MGFLSVLDPTGNNFLGAGKTVGRAIAGSITLGSSELARPDPYGSGRNTVFAKSIGGSATGFVAGAGTGFMVGGPWGAIIGGVLGAVGGGVAGGLGVTKNYTPAGFAENTAIGVGAGLTGGAAAHIGWAAAPAVGPSLPHLPTLATPAFSFGSLASLKTALGTVAGASILKKLLTPAQIANLGLPASNQGATAPPAMSPATNVSSYLLPPPSGNGGATTPTIINTSTPAAQQSYLWLLIVLALVGTYLYFRKKRHG